MGAGAKSDITQIRFADIWDTYHCGLSKAVRKRLQKLGIKRICRLYSAVTLRNTSLKGCNRAIKQLERTYVLKIKCVMTVRNKQ